MGQTVVKGIENLTDFVHGEKILLVRGNSFNSLGIRNYFDSLNYVEFTEVSPNPLYEQVCKGVDFFNQEKCETIIAVGGGSSIDVAKCIKLFCKMDRDKNYLEQEKADSGIKLIAIPTTAGTGSESTVHAVIYYNGVKQSISHSSILPDYAILEPSVLKYLPVYQKKCTMLDALSQAIESWWSVNSSDESIEFSRKAISRIKAFWEAYIFENDPSAADKIMEAANYAGRAINITATTAAHAMSYKLSSSYGLPHGHAVAICMPEAWRYILEHVDESTDNRGAGFTLETMEQIADSISLEEFNSMLDRMHISHPASKDKATEVEMLSHSVNTTRLKNYPMPVTIESLKKMYERIIK